MLAYLDQRNQNPKPFVWKADADLILGKVERLCQRISNQQSDTSPLTSSLLLGREQVDQADSIGASPSCHQIVARSCRVSAFTPLPLVPLVMSWNPDWYRLGLEAHLINPGIEKADRAAPDCWVTNARKPAQRWRGEAGSAPSHATVSL